MGQDTNIPTSSLSPANRSELLTYLTKKIKDNTDGLITPAVLADVLQQFIGLALLSSEAVPGLAQAVTAQVDALSQSLTTQLNGFVQQSNFDSWQNQTQASLALLTERLTNAENAIGSTSFTEPRRFLRTAGATSFGIVPNQPIQSLAFWVRVNRTVVNPGTLIDFASNWIDAQGTTGFHDVWMGDVQGNISSAALLSAADASSGPWRRIYLEPDSASAATINLLKSFHAADIANITLYDRTWETQEKVRLAMPTAGVVSMFDGKFSGNKLIDSKDSSEGYISGDLPEYIIT